MNRIILIGNGFDKAHNLKTGYDDFIYWYWKEKHQELINSHDFECKDCLCTYRFKTPQLQENWESFNHIERRPENDMSGIEVYKHVIADDSFFTATGSTFFKNINHSIHNKGWVDIENEYYSLLKKAVLNPNLCDFTVKELNDQLAFLQQKLTEYLSSLEITEDLFINEIKEEILKPINVQDISVNGMDMLVEHFINFRYGQHERIDRMRELYGIFIDRHKNERITHDLPQKPNERIQYIADNQSASEFFYPNKILVLSFNYTPTVSFYLPNEPEYQINYIHGTLTNPSSVIFGYGDELDEDYKKILNINDNELLTNIKSSRYLECDNYRKVLSFIESEPYQVFIMGHSCGNSDRTLLNSLFEHKNCASIKPFYYLREDGSDNYLDIVQNISRNFSNMNLMRDRVVNKQYCKPLRQTTTIERK